MHTETSAMGVRSRRQFLESCSALALRANAPAPAPRAIGGIKIGCCVPIRELQAVVQTGFDYLEPPAAALAELTPTQFEQVKHDVLASPIRCEAFNSFIRRKELVVVGPNVDLEAVKEYVDLTLARCRQLGATIVVWGSADSRNVPEGFPRERAWDQIATFLQAIAPIAGRHKIVISLEPLNRKESNILNTGRETLQMVNQVNLPDIKMIIDYYHLRLENESLSIFEEAQGKINHLHFAHPEGRLWPKSPDEDPLYSAFFDTIRRLNWTGGISVEGRGSAQADGRQALAFFRKELGK